MQFNSLTHKKVDIQISYILSHLFPILSHISPPLKIPTHSCIDSLSAISSIFFPSSYPQSSLRGISLRSQLITTCSTQSSKVILLSSSYCQGNYHVESLTNLSRTCSLYNRDLQKTNTYNSLGTFMFSQ